MSEALIRKVVNEKLLSDKVLTNVMKLTSHGQYKGKYKGKDYSRRLQQRHKGQLLILNNTSSIKAVLEYAFPDIEFDMGTMSSLLEAAQMKALQLHEEYKRKSPAGYDAQVRYLERNHPKHAAQLGKGTYLLHHFGEGAGRIGIDVVINEIYKKFKELTGKDLVGEYQAAKQMATGTGASEKPFVRGHGEEGGLSVIQGRAAVTLNILAEAAGATTEDIKNVLQDAIVNNVFELTSDEQSLLEKVVTLYSQVGDINGLYGEFTHIITVQDTMSNSDFSKVERQFGNAYFEQIMPYLTQHYLNLEGSSTMQQKAVNIVFNQFLSDLDKQNLVIKITDGKKVKLKTGGKVVHNYPKDKKGSLSKRTKKKSKKQFRASADSSRVSLRNLIPILNQRLPNAVAANMHSPALVNRTGRFANSVNIVDITQTPKGYPSVAYDYLKTPYKLFEFPTGDPYRATQERDPRKIIDRSIREVAIGIMEGRFFTRRV